MDEHKRFNVNQSALLLNGEGNILLLALTGTRKWLLPGGRLEDDSTPIDGLRREVKEETGIEHFEIENIFDVDLSDSRNSYLVAFGCRVEGVPVVRLSEEHDSYAWVGPAAISAYDFHHPKIAVLLKKYLNSTHGK